MGNRGTIRRFGKERRITKLISFILIIGGVLLGAGSYEILLFPHDARSLSLHNSVSAFDNPLLRNNPAALSMRAGGMVYSICTFRLIYIQEKFSKSADLVQG